MFWCVSDGLLMCQTFDRPDCVLNCRNMPDGWYPLCTECQKYAICIGEKTELKSCPDKQYWGFDSTTRQCRYKSPDCYDCTGTHERTHIYTSHINASSNTPRITSRYISGIATRRLRTLRSHALLQLLRFYPSFLHLKS